MLRPDRHKRESRAADIRQYLQNDNEIELSNLTHYPWTGKAKLSSTTYSSNLPTTKILPAAIHPIARGPYALEKSIVHPPMKRECDLDCHETTELIRPNLTGFMKYLLTVCEFRC